MLVQVRARLETGNNECRKRRIQIIPESVLFTPPFLPPSRPESRTSNASQRPIPGLAIGLNFQHSTPTNPSLAEPCQQISLFIRSRY